MTAVLDLRRLALEATIAEWRERPFELGKRDCLKMHISNLRKMGVNIPHTSKMIGYKTPLAGQALLKKLWKVTTVADWCDKFHQRILPSQALPSDVIALPGFGVIGALGIYMGNELVFCYEEEHDCPVAGRLTYEPGLEPIAAWRVLP